WSFKTACVPPEITLTSPAAGATGVALTANIVVTFSEAMTPGSVTQTIAPTIAVSASWSGGNTVLTLTHATPFATNTLYSVTIAGNDVDGNALVAGPVPNPWTFTTVAGLAGPGGLQVVRAVGGAGVVLKWRCRPG